QGGERSPQRGVAGGAHAGGTAEDRGTDVARTRNETKYQSATLPAKREERKTPERPERALGLRAGPARERRAMHVLVTGGSGYLGEPVVRKLRERGDEVTVLDVVDNADRPPHVRFIQGDIRDPDAVRRALDGVDVVHHDVAQVPLAKDR